MPTTLPLRYLAALGLLVPMLALTFARAQAPAQRWVGSYRVADESVFVRIEPHSQSGGAPLLHLPDLGTFERPLEILIDDDERLAFTAADRTFDGVWESDAFRGSVEGAAGEGSFVLHPVADPDPAAYEPLVGSYRTASGRTLLVSYQELLGTRHLFASEGGDFVRLYPLRAGGYLSAHGERVAFDGDTLTLDTGAGIEQAVRIAPYREEPVQLDVNGATLHGTLLLPHGDGPHPAVILGAGSGRGERNYWRLYADRFVQDGFAALIYDRRGSGRSGGDDGGLHSGLLAADVVALYRQLQTHPAVDADRIGLWGYSNASWVMPLAAEQLPDVAFVAVAGASAVSQVEAETYRRTLALSEEGVAPKSAERLLRTWELIYQQTVYQRWEDAWTAELEQLLETVATDPALAALPPFEFPPPIPLDVFLGQLGGALAHMGYAPADTYATLTAPVLFVIGELDENTAPTASIAAMERIAASRPEGDVTLLVLADTGHTLTAPPASAEAATFEAGFVTGSHGYSFREGYLDNLAEWMRAQVGLGD
jgi:alpha-beta hydrolase superfamily lysophospholipase